MTVENDIIPTRQSLLSRLKDWEDQESWKLFFDTYWKLIYTAATKAGLKDAEAQDVVQETVLSVLKSMPSFKYDPQKGSFKNWLMQLTNWRIIDHLRKNRREPRLAPDDSTELGELPAIERIPDPLSLKLEETWNREWEENLMEAAVERVKKRVDSKQFQAFDLHVCKQWPVAKVAKTLNISAARIYLVKHRINNLIKKEIALLQANPIRP
ncbi:MAG: sigma-70 family RNA polymerase sigma factor [Verrucomicrobiota bacterium]